MAWKMCSFHSIAYDPKSGCGLCSKQVEKSLYQNITDIRKMLENGFINKEPLVKINSELSNEIHNIINTVEEIRKLGVGYLTERLLEQTRSLNQIKKKFSDLL
jgi:virulence-associated protein VapD